MTKWRRWSRTEEERLIALMTQSAGTRQLEQVHAHLLLHGQSHNSYLAAKLVRTFVDLGCLQHARSIAHAILCPNAFVWTALIRGYSQRPLPEFRFEDAFLSYSCMRRSFPAVNPLKFTLSSVLKACARAPALRQGMQVHGHAFKYGFQFDASVQTTLIELYGKCRRTIEARLVFDKLLVSAGAKDVQVWNTMIAGYAEVGDMEAARYLFDSMPQWNTFTFVAMIAGYAAIGQMAQARRLLDDCLAPRDRGAVVCTAMIAGYTMAGDISAARSLFDEMKERDVAAWNAMIAAYSHSNAADEALGLFRSMQKSSLKPNKATIATIASACAQLGSPNLASWIQDYVDQHESELLNSHTVAALIDLHAKCGDLDRAYDLFERWRHKDLICFSSMIAGFGIHGRGKDAARVFEKLLEVGLNPDGICFVSLLTACSHAGMVREGRRYFESMLKEHCIAPSVEHYVCMVDLLGRAGFVDEAYGLIAREMPRRGVVPHARVWGALLNACRSHSNVAVGEEAARHLMELEPENTGNYVLLSNIYAKAGRWEGVAQVRAVMRSRGMKKPAGCSWVEVGSEGVRRFLTDEVYDAQVEVMLRLLRLELRAQGCLPFPSWEIRGRLNAASEWG